MKTQLIEKIATLNEGKKLAGVWHAEAAKSLREIGKTVEDIYNEIWWSVQLMVLMLGVGLITGIGGMSALVIMTVLMAVEGAIAFVTLQLVSALKHHHEAKEYAVVREHVAAEHVVDIQNEINEAETELRALTLQIAETAPMTEAQWRSFGTTLGPCN